MRRFDPLVSVIIPAYNAELHIERSVESVLAQTYSNLEIIVINDGSEDRTQSILEQYTENYKNLTVVETGNQGQGAARNLALSAYSQGDYVLFLDADDYLIPNCVERLVNTALQYLADTVIADWQLLNENGRTIRYSNYGSFINKDVLTETHINRLLEGTYFTVGRLYSREFLLQNHVFYGEGHIYEDMPFYVGSLLLAAAVAFLPYPVYNIVAHPQSSTKTNYKSRVHGDGFIKAVESTVSKYRRNLADSTASFIKHVLKDAYWYTFRAKRVPARQWLSFYQELFSQLRLLSSANQSVRLPYEVRYPLRVSASSSVGATVLFFALRVCKRLQTTKLARYIRRQFWRVRTRYRKTRQRIYRKTFNSERFVLDDNVIFVHGFDGALRGNTKYLLPYLARTGKLVVLILKSINNPVNHLSDNIKVVAPYSRDYYRFAAIAKYHILETWSDLGIPKRPGSIWIQMWHGTPIKRLLFDSAEPFVTTKSRRHKRNKFYDTRRWDYLLSQNSFCTEKLVTAFAFDRSKIVETGYPRTIAFEKPSITLRNRLNEKYKLQAGKQLILYAPTWRDYNRYSFGQNLDWLLDTNASEELAEFNLLLVGHPFSRNTTANSTIAFAENEDIQDLIAISDVLITDYSSILFDWLLTGKPFALLWKDEALFEYARGIYPEFKRDFAAFICTNEAQLDTMLMSFPSYEQIGNLPNYCLKSHQGLNGILSLLGGREIATSDGLTKNEPF